MFVQVNRSLFIVSSGYIHPLPGLVVIGGGAVIRGEVDRVGLDGTIGILRSSPGDVDGVVLRDNREDIGGRVEGSTADGVEMGRVGLDTLAGGIHSRHLHVVRCLWLELASLQDVFQILKRNGKNKEEAILTSGPTGNICH